MGTVAVGATIQMAALPGLVTATSPGLPDQSCKTFDQDQARRLDRDPEVSADQYTLRDGSLRYGIDMAP